MHDMIPFKAHIFIYVLLLVKDTKLRNVLVLR